MAEGIRVQQIWDFVVQIRHTSTDAIVGTGFVAREGIVTCAHVVRDAGVDPWGRDGLDVGIYYPEREGRSSITKRAKVAACFDQHDDDVVLLYLVDDSSPLGPELAAKFGPAKGSEAHEFLSFGYQRLQNYLGLPALGKILGIGDKPTDKKFQGGPLVLSSQNIDRGMSGAPVLDTDRDLIIGVIYLAWDPAGGPRNRDTSLAVDARVLSLEPLCLALEENDLPRSTSPSPKIDQQKARKSVAIREKVIWNNAPPSLAEWTGREQLLEDITSDWADARVRITGLIGFGGEGKSSLARKWIDQLLADSSRSQPNGVFWWGFYEKHNVDEFFNAAVDYLCGGNIDLLKTYPSSSAKAHFLAGMLHSGRYLFVLDGLEVLQYQDGDMYGSIRTPDLKAFLEFFASPDHKSFCLVTSRAPLVDMISFATYKHRDVDRLSPQDGRNLLRKLGVQGKDAELDKVVKDWDGHALTLSLLASYLKDYHDGDIAEVHNIPPPTADEPRYDRVHRILRRYDEHLDESAKAFLKLFSAFRRPVERDAFGKIFRSKSKDKRLNAPITVLDDSEFQSMVDKLVDYRILRYKSLTGQFTIHPLIRTHYSDLLTEDDRYLAEEAHQQIKDYYLSKAQDMPDAPTLDNLVPMIEAVHHACQCGDYDEAFNICQERINQREQFYIAHKLGKWETELEIMKEFFPNGDISKDPIANTLRVKGWILSAVGLCLDSIGQGLLAEEFYERGLNICLASEDWANASADYIDLSDFYLNKGEMVKGLQAASEALKLALRTKRTDYECFSLGYMAWIYHLQGDLKMAGQTFLDAEKALNGRNGLNLSLNRQMGIYYSDYLRRIGESNYSQKVAEANLIFCKGHKWLNLVSSCNRVIGDLFADAGKDEEGSESYSQALDIARSISHRLVLIEVLKARGRWYARHLSDSEAALSDLTEAFDYARAGGYRLYEADIRIGLAWAHLAAGNDNRARDEATYALQMSQDMGYHWGIVDAKEVLAKLDER